MIKEIDGLKLPPSVEGTAELMNRDTTRRTVSGRLITKLDPNEKWKVTASFESFSLALEFQKSFYDKCLAMRTTSAEITFISPYDGTEKTIKAKCTQRTAPTALNIYGGKPQLYSKVGAVFEEV